MSTKEYAYVNIKNTSQYQALIQLYHYNSSYGAMGGGWLANSDSTVGGLKVPFNTGLGSELVEDYWWVCFTAYTIDAVGRPVLKGTYSSCGNGVLYPSLTTTQNWAENQLQTADAGKTMVFTVDTQTLWVNLMSSQDPVPMALVKGTVPALRNVFVLMLENHSFDNMFAMSGISGITGATTQNSNSYDGETYYVQNGAPASMPTDPGHEFPDVLQQLAGAGAAYPSGGSYPPITNSGFASSYATSTTEGPAPQASDIGDIMECFTTSSQLPVIYELATQFALCDHWYSSLPGPTWPNRFFAHGASSSGLDHSPTEHQMAEWETVDGFTYPNGSIFDKLTASTRKWRLYHDVNEQTGDNLGDSLYSDDPSLGDGLEGAGFIPQVCSLDGIYMTSGHSLSELKGDLQRPYAYAYTFIEPHYGNASDGSYEGGSSQHPMDDVYGGEAMIKAVYEAIRNSPIWYSSLLIITYDEHGGFYDSVAPGPAPAPNDGSSNALNEYGFTFEQYGVRVPAVIVSSQIPKGVVSSALYDHSSIPATLEHMFGLTNLTDRDKAANNVAGLCVLMGKLIRQNCPTTLNSPAAPVSAGAKTAPTPEEQAAIELQPLPSRGNFIGFLQVLLKTELELSSSLPEARTLIVENFKKIKTRGDAKAYARRVGQMVQDYKAKYRR